MRVICTEFVGVGGLVTKNTCHMICSCLHRLEALVPSRNGKENDIPPAEDGSILPSVQSPSHDQQKKIPVQSVLLDQTHAAALQQTKGVRLQDFAVMSWKADTDAQSRRYQEEGWRDEQY